MEDAELRGIEGLHRGVAVFVVFELRGAEPALAGPPDFRAADEIDFLEGPALDRSSLDRA